MQPTRHWQDLAWTDFAALPKATVAVLPVAAIEQHGPHLPLSVDADINAGVLDAALALLPDGLPVLVLPMQCVGLSVEHARFPGTLTLSAETLLSLLTELGRSVQRAGVRRLVVLNSHGGQPGLLDIVCRRLRGDGLFAVNCMISRLGLPPAHGIGADELDHGIHGGLIETSLMLHLHPARVRMEQAEDFRSAWLDRQGGTAALTPEGGIGFGWEAQDLHPMGALGDAAAATAKRGASILEFQAARLASLLRDVSAFDLDGWLRDSPAVGEAG